MPVEEMIVPRIKNTKNQGNYASYDIEPLEVGYSMTLGSSLKRALLSLVGAAVTSLRIEGVKPGSESIPHVQEAVSEIVLNVKQLRLRSFSDQPVSMRLDVSGEREITATDIIAPSTVEIVNPELHLATLNHAHARLAMELTVEVGRGYVPARVLEDLPMGVIPLDAIYTPVLRVEYIVEHTRVDQKVNFDKLVLGITTNGTISPDQGLRRSADILMRHFTLLTNKHIQAKAEEQTPLSSLPIPQKIYDTPLAELDLSIRAYNSLKRWNITKVGQVLSMGEEDLLGVRNFGERSLQEFRTCLLARNFLPALPTSAIGVDTDADPTL
ncbi:MAG TPA: DNA-directed RNA polymerase subunit alpha [Ktedonobacteraceae bacterium]|nr:DNA-directed RNA polymerase subunit alpha [Ktedonobacteraceae bacterium]